MDPNTKAQGNKFFLAHMVGYYWSCGYAQNKKFALIIFMLYTIKLKCKIKHKKTELKQALLVSVYIV